ncbi:hypothetical protein ONA91_03720 [Micromonospora sp. DR5-3]|uniref:hypothetical protein n=1 Tax=unclassified Micromonospora TaxID=2617518 RepID=UPI0011D8F8E6|nr:MULTISPECIES: hypothetical protein [unclassified Micromonospora]MCW3813568.1 hypothetical protein [Micromonospora sp. DR5-3]TYC25727.1 hypothetical protein FXF52_04770 [Micromonospora sp. MP36]
MDSRSTADRSSELDGLQKDELPSYSFSGHRIPSKEPDRRVNIEIWVPGGMTEQAMHRYAACVNEFSMALSRETSRLEEAERADVVDAPEITATMVVKANDEVRNPRRDPDPPIPPWAMVAQLAAFTAAMFAGVFGSYLNSRWQWWSFIGCAVIGVLAQGYAIAALRRRR